jgi:hypothetical protein
MWKAEGVARRFKTAQYMYLKKDTCQFLQHLHRLLQPKKDINLNVLLPQRGPHAARLPRTDYE